MFSLSDPFVVLKVWNERRIKAQPYFLVEFKTRFPHFGNAAALRKNRFAVLFSMVYPCHSPAQKRWFLMHSACTEASPNAIVLSHTDITARVAAEAALIDATGRLREADRHKDEFLATLAHELRNPLAPILSGLHVLHHEFSGRRDAGKEMKALALMQRQAVHLTRLADDLLEVSRITRGKIVLKRAKVGLVEVLRHALETAQPDIERGGHVLDVRLSSSPVFVDGDAVRLAQVFTNLLNNAAKDTEHVRSDHASGGSDGRRSGRHRP